MQQTNLNQPLMGQAGYMANPMLPENAVNRNFQNQQEYKQTLQENGLLKLQKMNQCYLRTTNIQGFTDLSLLKRFPQEVSIKYSKEAYENAFQIRFDEVKCCRSNLQGKVYSLNYDQNGVPHEEEIYQIKQKRNNFLLRNITCCLLPIFCSFCWISKCSKSKAKLLDQGGQQKTEITFGSQFDSKSILDVDHNNNKFELIASISSEVGYNKTKKYLVKKQGQSTSIQVFFEFLLINIDKHGNRHYIASWKWIDFGNEHLSPEEKMSLVYMISQLY